jgi:8-oxo-dGTP pyrophosphatase MutT (NUDIX family)
LKAEAATLARIRAALHPLDDVPQGDAWNAPELEGLLPHAGALRPAAVLLALVPRECGLRVVLTLRKEDLRHHAGQVSFPGGRIEPDDDGPLQAALREAREEIALDPARVQPLGWLDPLATITGFRVVPLVAVLEPDTTFVPDPREVASVFEVPLAHLLAPSNLRRVAIQFRGRPRHVLEYLPHDGGARIWGATASMLQNLIDRMQRAPA